MTICTSKCAEFTVQTQWQVYIIYFCFYSEGTVNQMKCRSSACIGTYMLTEDVYQFSHDMWFFHLKGQTKHSFNFSCMKREKKKPQTPKPTDLILCSEMYTEKQWVITTSHTLFVQQCFVMCHVILQNWLGGGQTLLSTASNN